jgi:NitT/TauT family transport system ATP-binding protein
VKTPVLEARSASKWFEVAGGQRLTAVNRINITVWDREFLCIVGPSGCGKTTLLHMLGGLTPSSGGEVWLDGQPVTAPSPEISFVFQKSSLMPWRTVSDNIMLPLQVQGIPLTEAKNRTHEILAMVGLSDFGQSYPKHVSGGMEQRVALARALIQRPRILLLDEPFGALDALTSEHLNKEILRLWREQNFTAVMVTHNIREAVYLADRVLVLSPRPAQVAAEFQVDLPRPRPEGIAYTEQFGNLAYSIRTAITA